jgi:hypothetical protein
MVWSAPLAPPDFKYQFLEVPFLNLICNYSAKKVVYIAREKLITVHDNAANERTAPGTDRTRS